MSIEVAEKTLAEHDESGSQSPLALSEPQLPANYFKGRQFVGTVLGCGFGFVGVRDLVASACQIHFADILTRAPDLLHCQLRSWLLLTMTLVRTQITSGSDL